MANKNNSKRKKISESTQRILWAMSAGRCEKCGRLIYQHPSSKVIGNFAQIAHSIPVGDSGPRYQYKQIDTTIDINDFQNLLLLCYDCHHEIDEVCPEEYPPSLLHKIKTDFEEFVIKATNIKHITPTLVITYSPNFHGQKLKVVGTQKALFPQKYIHKTTDLTLKDSSFFPNDTQYWDIEQEHLLRSFQQKVIPAIEDYQDGFLNMSVFAVGPIPLMVQLGYLLSNKHNIDIYQLKKSPIQTWEWEAPSVDTNYNVSYLNQTNNVKKIVLLLSLSGQIRYEEVKSTTSWDDSIVLEVTPDHQQYDDFLRNKLQLDKFVYLYRKLKEELRKKGNQDTIVHVFAAIPAAVAIELGRQHNPTFDLPMIIYNYTNGQYVSAITIGDIHE